MAPTGQILEIFGTEIPKLPDPLQLEAVWGMSGLPNPRGGPKRVPSASQGLWALMGAEGPMSHVRLMGWMGPWAQTVFESLRRALALPPGSNNFN